MSANDFPDLPPAWPGAQVYTDRARIFVRRSGHHDAPSLMLLHGWGVHGGMFEGPLRNVLEPRFELLVPDLRGHGYSSTPTNPRRWELRDYVDDLVRALDHLQIERVHLAGYSMGGFVALGLAQAHPDRIARLGLVCTAARHPDKVRRNLVVAQSAFRVLPPQTMQFVASRLLSGPGVPRELQKVMGWLLGYNTRGGLSGAAGAMRRADLSAGLADLMHPTLLVTAEHDVAIPRYASHQLLEAIPNVHHHHFDDAGHALAASHGRELARVMLEFFGQETP